MSETIEDGVWQILEPIMKVEVNGPEEHQVNFKSIFHFLGGSPILAQPDRFLRKNLPSNC